MLTLFWKDAAIKCVLPTQHRIGEIGGLAKRLIDLAERAANRVAAFSFYRHWIIFRCYGKVTLLSVCFKRQNVGPAF